VGRRRHRRPLSAAAAGICDPDVLSLVIIFPTTGGCLENKLSKQSVVLLAPFMRLLLPLFRIRLHEDRFATGLCVQSGLECHVRASGGAQYV